MNNDHLDEIPQRSPDIVYVKTNSDGYITGVNSSAFLTDTAGWTEIDSGFGFRFYHAQNNYFPESIWVGYGIYRYKMVHGKPVECTKDEIAEQVEANTPDTPSPTLESRVGTLENDSTEMKEALEMILSGVTE